MSIAFFQTIMGRKFYDADVPALIRELRDLNQNLARLADLIAVANAAQNRTVESPPTSGTPQ